MQYKLCRAAYRKVKQPLKSFALAGVSHVGEDSGWLWAGLPVHAIMDGKVVQIQHEESWGCLVCIESILPDSEVVCAYYGHLSSSLDVYIGQDINKGDKLGEIGPPFTLQNGGYRSHLHLGIEKAAIEEAVIAGYHADVERWYDPVVFLGSRQRSTGQRRQ